MSRYGRPISEKVKVIEDGRSCPTLPNAKGIDLHERAEFRFK
jgi:hypothetical protein